MNVAVPTARGNPHRVISERSWFDRSALAVARELLGKRLVMATAGGTVAGRIVETEAYLGPEDLAAHSSRGRTPRNAVMFGPPGHAYVYRIYGLHHCLNVVCGPGDKPEAVLLRAAAIDEGLQLAWQRRGPVARERLAAGPGNLAAAFGMNLAHDGIDLLDGPLSIEDGTAPPAVVARRRIGVEYAANWADRPLRFLIPGDPHRSRP